MRNWLLLLLLLLAVFSCREDEVFTNIDIAINAPYESQSFVFGDTLKVEAHLNSSKTILNISLQVYNEDFVPAGTVLNIPCTSNTITIKEFYPLDTDYKYDGTYYLKLTAFNETGSSKFWRKIKINDISRILKGLTVHCKSNQASDFYYVDALNQYSVTPLFSKPTDVDFSAVCNRPSLVFVSGSYFEPLEAIDPETGEVQFTIPAIHNPPEPWFTGVQFVSDKLFVMYYNGQIKLYYPNGSQFQTISPIGSLFPVYAEKTGNYYLVIRQNKIGLQYSLAVHYSSTTALKHSLNLSFTPLSVLPGPDNNFYVIGNQNGQGKIMVYNIEANSMWEPHSFPYGKIISVAGAEQGEMYIASENGIYWYRYNDNSLTLFSGMKVYRIKYESINKSLYFSTASQLYFTFSQTPQGIIPIASFQDSIQYFHLNYTR